MSSARRGLRVNCPSPSPAGTSSASRRRILVAGYVRGAAVDACAPVVSARLSRPASCGSVGCWHLARGGCGGEPGGKRLKDRVKAFLLDLGHLKIEVQPRRFVLHLLQRVVLD